MPNWESALTLLESGAITATGQSASVDLGSRDRLLRQSLVITAASGTSPSITVRLESSADDSTGWKTFGTFSQFNTTATERLTFISPDRYVRVAYTVSGTTPSFTLSVIGYQGVAFANLEQFDTYGLPSATTTATNTSPSAITPTRRCESIAATTEMVSAILAGRYDAPLSSWGLDLTQAVCKITAYDLLSVRGFSPDGRDSNVRARYDDAMKWLADVANNRVNPAGIVDTTTGDDDTGGVEAVTYAPRAWR
jgi:phage gp36-like protein